MTSWVKLGGVIDRFDAIMSNWVLVSLPMFVYMGLMLDRSGVADTMMRNFVKVFGGIRGGLGLTVVFIGILLAASTGIVGASVVLLAMLSMPIMLQHHYSKAHRLGLVAASGTLGILIPPSIMLVLMADQVSVSVGDLFMGALVPGVGWACCTWCLLWWSASCGPTRAAAPGTMRRKADAAPGRHRLLSTLPTFGLILVVLGRSSSASPRPPRPRGWVPLGRLCWRRANRKLSWKVIREVGIETTLTTCFIFAIFIGATVFAYVLRMIGGDELITEFFKGTGPGPDGAGAGGARGGLRRRLLSGLVRDRAHHPAAAGTGDQARRHRHDLVPDPDRADAADLVPDAAGGLLALLPEGRGAQGRDDPRHLPRRDPLRC
jgi:tripartite ATP-independent transporter DctM subunit